MPTTFTASSVAASREEWGWLAVLGDIEAMDRQPYLMFQRAHEFSADDVRLGQDRPYVEICDQGWSWYGQIERVELHPTMVKLQMSETASRLMENDGAFTFRFSLPAMPFQELRTVLDRIFEGCAFYARVGM